MVATTLQAAWEGLGLVLSWPNVLYPVAATLLSMIVAFLPGISGVTLMALAVPFTLFWDPLPVVLTFGGLIGGATFMGSVTAILFNVPGSGPSAATLLDGYPLARQGQAKAALGCAALASALGSTFGIVVLMALIPLMHLAVLAFGPPELLMLLLWGLTTIAVIVQGSVVRALIATGIGLLLALVGQDVRTGELRFTLGSLHLWEGLGLVPVMLGLFSVAEMLHLGASGRGTISGLGGGRELTGSVREGAMAVLSHPGLFLRSALVGTCVGVIPGVGGTVASFLAYGQAVATSPDRERFGKGDIRGVLAPEAAHDAKDGAALIPVLAFGIPGSDGTAVLLGVLLLHGLVPGRDLLTSQLTLVFALIWSLFLSNWLTSVLGLLLVNPLARLTTVRLERLAPIGLSLAVAGAFADRQHMGDVLVAVAFGLLGFYMKKHDWPRMALVVAFLLGGGIERNLHITSALYGLGRLELLARPLLGLLVVLTCVNLALPYLRSARLERAGRRS
jgi:putative tricarboxylic transport membrane protein